MDKEAFKKLYLQYYSDVFRYLYFICNNHEVSCDITQETFLKLWEQRGKIKEHETLMPFLFKISKNLLNDYYRHNKVVKKYVDNEVYSGVKSDNQESALHAKLLEEKIREVVSKNLSTKTQSVFIMSRFEGKSNDDISKLMGIAKKTVENQLHNAMCILRKKVKHYL